MKTLIAVFLLAASSVAIYFGLQKPVAANATDGGTSKNATPTTSGGSVSTPHAEVTPTTTTTTPTNTKNNEKKNSLKAAHVQRMIQKL